MANIKQRSHDVLNLYLDYSKVFRNGKKNWCKSHGVSLRAMNKAEKIKEQLSHKVKHRRLGGHRRRKEKEKKISRFG